MVDHGKNDKTAPAVTAGTISAFARALMSYAGRKGIVMLALMLVVGLTEGIGLLMLIPMLQLIGLSGDSGAENAIVAAMTDSLATIGVPLTLPTLLTAYVVLVTLRAVLVRRRELTLAEIRLGFVDHLRLNLQDAVSRASWQFLAHSRSANFSHVLTTDVTRINQGTTAFLMMLVDSVVALAYVAVAAGLSPAITLLALLSGGALAWTMAPQNRRARQLGAALTTANREMFAVVSEFLGGLKMVKSYGAEAQHTAAFTVRVGDIRDRLLDFNRMSTKVHMRYTIGSVVAISVFFYIAADVLGLAATSLLMLVFIFARLLPMAARLQQNYLQFLHVLPAFQSVVETTARCATETKPPPKEDVEPLTPEQEIRFQGVRFGYDGDREESVLKSIDLVIPMGRTTAIVGPSGAGKSTVADLLMGLLTPDRGAILIDGVPLQSDGLHAWRRSVAYVPQEAFTFNDTLRNNVIWPAKERSEEELWQALELAAAADFVRALPNGLDTEVGERGIRLSGGERQRVALARAILRRPALLLLDEATSAVDAENERRIQTAIEGLRGEMTIVIIAHRFSTLRHADLVVVLDGGQIVESGRWNDLEARQGGRLRALLLASGEESNEIDPDSEMADAASGSTNVAE